MQYNLTTLNEVVASDLKAQRKAAVVKAVAKQNGRKGLLVTHRTDDAEAKGIKRTINYKRSLDTMNKKWKINPDNSLHASINFKTKPGGNLELANIRGRNKVDAQTYKIGSGRTN